MGTFKIVKLVGQGLNNTVITGGFVPKGAYDNAVDYAVGDSVSYQGSSYVMHTNAGAGNLPTDTTYWQLLAQKGTDATIGGSNTQVQFNDSGSFGGDSGLTYNKTTDTLVPVNVQVNQTAFFDAEVDNGNSGTSDTIDWTLGNKQKTTLNGNCTYTFTAPPGPCNLLFKLVHSGSNRNPSWPATVKWTGGVEPTWSTTDGSVDIASFYYDGTNYYGAANIGFA